MFVKLQAGNRISGVSHSVESGVERLLWVVYRQVAKLTGMPIVTNINTPLLS